MIWKIINISTVAILVGFISVFLFWSLYPYRVSSVTEPITILNENKQIAIGEKIEMELQVSKPNNLIPTGSVYITCDDGNLVTMTGLPVNLPVGDYAFINNRYTLPPKVAVGSKCVFHFDNVYQVNPIKKVNRNWATEPFTVIER